MKYTIWTKGSMEQSLNIKQLKQKGKKQCITSTTDISLTISFQNEKQDGCSLT